MTFSREEASQSQGFQIPISIANIQAFSWFPGRVVLSPPETHGRGSKVGS